MIFVKLSWRKHANSENFANSEITPEDFANSEPGAKFRFSLGLEVAIGGCFHNLLCNKHSLLHQVSNAHHTLRFLRKKMHGQLLTESIRFKVTLEVNMARAEEELGLRVLRFWHMNG
jgi:hypothetical protein